MGFWDVVSAPTEALGGLAGDVAEALTGNETAKDVVHEVVARGPGGGIADEVGKAMGLNEAQRGYLEVAAGVATWQSGGIQGVMYGVHDIVEGRQNGDDVFAAPGDNQHRMYRHSDDGGSDTKPHGAVPISADPGNAPSGGTLPEIPSQPGYAPPVVTTTTTTTSGGTTTTTTTTTGGTAGANGSSDPTDAQIDSDISAILNNPNLSLEAKVSMLMAKLQEKEERHIGTLMGQISDQATANDKLRAAGHADQVKTDPTLQTQLQMAMERRSELATLTSNFSKSEHDTRSQIIGNIR